MNDEIYLLGQETIRNKYKEARLEGTRLDREILEEEINKTQLKIQIADQKNYLNKKQL